MGSLMNIATNATNLHYEKHYEEAIKLLDRYFKSVTNREDLAQCQFYAFY